MKFRDKYGWPVTRLAGRPIVNLIRILLHVNFRKTWKYRNCGPETVRFYSDVNCQHEGIGGF